MDTSLVTVTLLSMAMAAALSLVVWRLLREERRRSEARVVALSEMAQRPERSAPIERSRVSPAQVRIATGSPATSRPAATTGTAPLDLPLNEARHTSTAAAPALLSDPVSPSPWGHRLVIMLGLALAGAAIVFFTLAASERTTAARPIPATGTAAAPNASNGGLELLSLRDTKQPGTLTVTGLVQNAQNGVMLKNVSVTAIAFDENGAFLASGRALLDVTSLAPGDESPFVVTVPVSDAVSRYRIGFRGEDGHVISHVDRRQIGTVAQNW
jgi:hypothetical protein